MGVVIKRYCQMLNLIYIAYLFVFGLFVCLFSLTNSPKVKA